MLSVFMQVRATYEEEVVGLDAVDHGSNPDGVPLPTPAGRDAVPGVASPMTSIF